MSVTQSACGTTCNPNGGYASPLSLPTTGGGTIANRLDYSAREPGHDLWSDCSSGEACDWYAMTLAEHERVTVTVHNVFDSLCRVDVGILSPSEQLYWQGASDHTAMAFDSDGSMEANGAQLTFVAPRAGAYRIRVRDNFPASPWYNCPAYQMTVARTALDAIRPEAIH